MHDTVRACYPYALLFDAITRLLNMRQQDHEHLNDYVKRFKQVRDVLRSHIGTDILHRFVENTEEYQNADSGLKSELLAGSFERFMAYVLIRNSDKNKYGSVIHGLVSQYSMEHDQYPKSLIAATDILANHRHDNYNKKKSPWKDSDDKQ